MSEMTEAELQDLQKQWKAVSDALDNAWTAIIEIMRPAIEAIKQIALYFTEIVQRAYLYELLPQWIPGTARAWLARHWPRALLPELAAVIEWMKAETTAQWLR